MTLHDILSIIWMGKPLSLWLAFFLIVFTLLVFDLGVLNRKDHEIGFRESLGLSAFYITISVAFGVWVWVHFGPEKGEQFFTGYLIEKTLSLDNVFVISLVFAYVGIPRILQHRVLFWGVLGVLILRGALIAGGTELITHFHWTLHIFAAFLVIMGVRMLFSDSAAPDIEKNPILGIMKRLFRVTPDLQGHHFFVRQPHPKTGKLVHFATPLLLALVLVEGADILFAVDSVPAIFVVTRDPYIIYTSNVFAILGLRALYFALAAVVHRFHYLKYAMALILVFIGGKIFAVDLLHLQKIPSFVSLGVTVTLITGGIVYSLWRTRRWNERYRKLRYGERIFILNNTDEDSAA